MKLGVNSYFLLRWFGFEEALQFVQSQGVTAIEIAVDESEQTRRFCDVDALLSDRDALHRWLDVLQSHGLAISAFCAHGDPLSPDRDVANAYTQFFRKVCQLAEAAKVDRIVVISGIPEGAAGEISRCWVVDSARASNRNILRWQWEQRLVPYWQQQAKVARDHGCLICVEPQIGELVYSPGTLMKLRQAIGPVIGCNLDPSHMFVQQIDLFEAIRFLGNAIYHVHIKDTRFDTARLKLQGILDNTSYLRPEERSWMFTIVGWGHDQRFWEDFVTTLRFAGYEGSLSIEMESEYISVKEGLEKSIAFLKPLVLQEPPGTKWWQHAGLGTFEED